jgi:hypothetical protein
MTLRLNDIVIENLNRYPEAIVDRLREALRDGALVVPDPKRRNFFEVYSEDQGYYIDLLENGRRVILLSAWSSAN